MRTLSKLSSIHIISTLGLILALSSLHCNSDACREDAPIYFPDEFMVDSLVSTDMYYGYFKRISRADISAQMNLSNSQDLEIEGFQYQLKQTTSAASPAQKQRLKEAYASVNCRLEQVHPAFQSPEISFLIGDGSMQGESTFYTRNQSIYVPAPQLEKWTYTDRILEEILAHELYHILSRLYPEFREKCFNALGYYALDKWKSAADSELDIPPSLSKGRVLNPDEPAQFYVYPYSDRKAIVNFLLLKDSSENLPYQDRISWHAKSIKYDGKGFLIDSTDAPDEILQESLKEVIGITDYVIHPEEMSADIFSEVLFDFDKDSDLQVKFRKIIQGL